MPTLQEQAETHRLARMMGLVEPSDVISWADRLIAEMADPPIHVIEIALATNQSAVGLASMLRKITGNESLEQSAHRVLYLLKARFDEGMPLDVVTNMLYVYSIEAEISEHERDHASHFYYAYEDLQYHGSAQSLSGDIAEFLSRYAAYPSTHSDNSNKESL